MTAVITPFRLKGKDFASCEGMPFQQHFEARVDRPLDDLDMNQVFQDLQSALRVGDQVTICAYMDNRWDTLMQVGVARIVHKDPREKTVQAAWITKPFDVPKADFEKKAFMAKERKLTIKKEFGGGFTVQDDKGNVIERVKTKAEAADYVARLNNPEAAKKAQPVPTETQTDLEGENWEAVS